MVPTAITLWYHHINISPLCHNGTLVWLRLTYTSSCMSTLQCNVMVPSYQSISVTPWYPGILLWYASVSHTRHAYSHIAAYAAIALPKGTFRSHGRNVMVPSSVRFGNAIMVSGILERFRSYLVGRRQHVRTSSSTSVPAFIGTRPYSLFAVHCRCAVTD